MKRVGIFVLMFVLGVARADEWTLRVVGNLEFGQTWTPVLAREGVEYPFAEIAGFLQDADLTMGFLHEPIAIGGEPDTKSTNPRRSTPDVARALKFAGFDAVALASPHLMDFRGAALEETLFLLDAQDIQYFGAGANDSLARMYAFHAVGDTTVASLAYLHGISHSHATQTSPGTNPALPSIIRDDIANARENADVVLVFVHWGETPGDAVDGKQRLVAETAIDAGATAVFGLRDQIWQGVEVYKSKPILYSLPDFVRGTDAKRFGDVTIPTVVFDGATPLRVEFSAVRVDAALKVGDDLSSRLQPRLLEEGDAQPAIDAYLERCASLNTPFEKTASGLILRLLASETD